MPFPPKTLSSIIPDVIWHRDNLAYDLFSIINRPIKLESLFSESDTVYRLDVYVMWKGLYVIYEETSLYWI